MGSPAVPAGADVDVLRRRAKQIRRNVVTMASGKGEGYVGQGLDVADILAVLFLSEMRYDPVDRGPTTDRRIFSAGYRIKGWPARIFNFMTDGETQEGSTWESAMFAGHERLGNLMNVIDVNRTQADGALVLEIEPLVD